MISRVLTCIIYYALISISLVYGSFCLANQQAPLLLTKEAIGPITKNTPYDLHVIKKLFPSLEVKKELNGTEGESFEVLVIYQHNKPLLTIVPTNNSRQGKLLCISFLTNDIQNTLGAAIGSRYSSIYKNHVHANCIPGLEEMAGFVVCSAPNAKNIQYVFKGSGSGEDGRVPPIAILKNWTVKQITWLASEQYPLEEHQFCRAINLSYLKS